VKEADQQAMSAILANTAAFSRPELPERPQKAKTDALIKGHQEETRISGIWQSFTCNSCGRIVQVSPAFKLPQFNCTHCGHLFRFV
jgi:hypothetical protein